MKHGNPVFLLNFRTVSRKAILWECGNRIAEKANAVSVMERIGVAVFLMNWDDTTLFRCESRLTSA
jgi:hypothetical protein